MIKNTPGLPPPRIETNDRVIVAAMRRCGLWETAKAARKRRPGKSFAIVAPTSPGGAVTAFVWPGFGGWLAVQGDPLSVTLAVGPVLAGHTEPPRH